MSLYWLSVDARTGVVIADLPDLDVGSVSRSICRYDTTTASLPVPTAPSNWLEATRPGATCLILLDDGVPIWGGLVTQRPRGSGDLCVLSVATIEAYLDRRYVGSIAYAAGGQNAIAADLIARYVATGPRGGIPIRVVQVGGAGTPRDRVYQDMNDKTVYSVLTELSGVIGGPEWTIEWEHQTSPERYTPVMYVGARIGAVVTPGLAPAATFEMPGCVMDALYLEDYSAGQGANVVLASSSGTGTTRPQSPLQISVDDGRPTYEYRFSPSTSITTVSTLTDHAARALLTLAPGSSVLTMSAAVKSAPQLGTDWALGDDVGYQLGRVVPGTPKTTMDGYADVYTDVYGGVAVTSPGTPVESVPAFPGGMSGVARCFEWALTLGQTPLVTPTLVLGA